MGGLLQKMQQKIGGLMKMGGQSGGMGSGGMTGGSGGMQQIMQKLSQVCQTASTSGGLSASGLLNGISLTGSSSQQSNYVNDLGAATNIINGQLF